MHLVWARSEGGSTYHLGIYTTERLALASITEHGEKSYALGRDKSYTVEEMRPGWKSVTVRQCGEPEARAVFYITELAVDAEIPDTWEIK